MSFQTFPGELSLNHHPLSVGTVQRPFNFSRMQEVPSKKGEKLSYIAPLKKYISSNYSEDPAAYETDLQALEDLRARAVNTPDVDNSLKSVFLILHPLMPSFANFFPFSSLFRSLFAFPHPLLL